MRAKTATILLLACFTLSLSILNSSGQPGTDFWNMRQHDPSHLGYSTSTAPITNQTLWISKIGNNPADSSPAVVEGKVYIGSLDNKTYCLDANSGASLWNFTTGHWITTSPAVVSGKVYIGSHDNKLYCLDALTGLLLWNFSTGDWVLSSPNVIDGKVYFGSYDKRVYCIDASDGSQIWNYTAGSTIVSSPAVANGKVYVGSNDKKLHCLNASTGTQLWDFITGDWVYSSPAVVADRVYFSSLDNKTYCLNATTGNLFWNYSTSFPVYSSPAIANGKVFFTELNQKIDCLDAFTGALLWNYSTGYNGYSSPAIADGKVYFGSHDGKIYCLNASSGAFIWSYLIGNQVDSSPAIADGKVYICSDDQRFFCFGSSISPTPSSTPTLTPNPTATLTPYPTATRTPSATGLPPSPTPTPTPSQLTSFISQSSATVIVGQSVAFAVTPSGGKPPYTYQWYEGTNPILGQTSSTLSITKNSAGSYTFYCQVIDGLSESATSNPATLTVNPPPTQLTASISQPSATVIVGQSVAFAVTPSGLAPPYTYQWYEGANPILGQTSPTLGVTKNLAGSYTFYCKVTDATKVTAISNSVTLIVNPQLTVSISPFSATGQSATFTVTAFGGIPPYTYQWYEEATPLTDQTNDQLVVAKDSAGTYTFYCKVTDAAAPPETTNTNLVSLVFTETVVSDKFPTLYVVLAAVIGVAAVTLIVWQRRKKTSVKKVANTTHIIHKEIENPHAIGNADEKTQKSHLDVFISYSKLDKVVADALCAKLESRKIRCWIAPRDVLPGTDFAAAVIQALNDSHILVLVFSKEANTSQHVMREVQVAVSRGMPIIPFRIENVEPADSMEYYLSTQQWLDAMTPPLEKHIQRLADIIQVLLSSKEGADSNPIRK